MGKVINVVIYLLLAFTSGSCNKSDKEKVLKMLKSMDYDKDIRPNEGVGPVLVNVSMHIFIISSISEVNMDFTSQIFLRQKWNDERLTYNETNGLKYLTIGLDFMKKIWSPDTFFANGKQISLHSQTNLQSNSYIKIEPNGDVLYSIMLTVVASCPMNLQYFPADTQLCTLEMESYGYSTKDIQYKWMGKGASLGTNLEMPQFKIIGHRQRELHEALSSGNYTRLVFEIAFRRAFGYYFIQIYIPAVFIVIISWIPFWLKRDDNIGRVGLGVTTLLTITTLITNNNESMPKISYIKLLDIYLVFCFAIVFASLIQYAMVGFFAQRQPEVDSVEENSSNGKRARKYRIRISPGRVDLHCRWIFPILFIVFNIWYWSFVNSSEVNTTYHLDW